MRIGRRRSCCTGSSWRLPSKIRARVTENHPTSPAAKNKNINGDWTKSCSYATTGRICVFLLPFRRMRPIESRLVTAMPRSSGGQPTEAGSAAIRARVPDTPTTLLTAKAVKSRTYTCGALSGPNAAALAAGNMARYPPRDDDTSRQHAANMPGSCTAESGKMMKAKAWAPVRAAKVLSTPNLSKTNPHKIFPAPFAIARSPQIEAWNTSSASAGLRKEPISGFNLFQYVCKQSTK